MAPVDHRCDLGSNVVASEAAGPCSIPGGVNFLVEVFPVFFSNVRQMSGNFGHVRPRVSFGHYPKPYRPSADGDGL